MASSFSKQTLNVSKEVVESAIFIHSIELKKFIIIIIYSFIWFDLKTICSISFRLFLILAVGVTQNTRSFYKAVHSVITKVLNTNGYSEVNLSKLFSSFFV